MRYNTSFHWYRIITTIVRVCKPNLFDWLNAPWPLDSILDAVLTVSPNKQYLGILHPTTPAAHGPKKNLKVSLSSIKFDTFMIYIAMK